MASSASLVALVALSGCGDGRPGRVPVSGKVVIDGEPLTSGSVVFVPEHGRQSIGNLDKDGHFVLSSYASNDGAVLGKHKIRILTLENLSETTLKYHAPKRYEDVQTSGLSEVITGPTDSVLISLTWEGDPHGKPYTEVSGPAVEDPFEKRKREAAKKLSKESNQASKGEPTRGRQRVQENSRSRS
jgi:hypothetical protein